MKFRSTVKFAADLGFVSGKDDSPQHILGVAQAGASQQKGGLRQRHRLLLLDDWRGQNQVASEGVQRCIGLLTAHLPLHHRALPTSPGS